MDIKHLSFHINLTIVFSVNKMFSSQDFKSFWIHRSMLLFSLVLPYTFIMNFYVKKITFNGIDIAYFSLIEHNLGTHIVRYLFASHIIQNT